MADSHFVTIGFHSGRDGGTSPSATVSYGLASGARSSSLAAPPRLHLSSGDKTLPSIDHLELHESDLRITSKICSCPSIFTDHVPASELRVDCFKRGAMPAGYEAGGKTVVDECNEGIGYVDHLSGNTWAARTVHETVTDCLRYFTCPYDAASWLHAIHDNERGLKIPRGCNSDNNSTDDGCRS